MAIEWKDRIVEHPRRYQLVPVAGQDGVFDFVPVTGEVTEVGTLVNSFNLNNGDYANIPVEAWKYLNFKHVLSESELADTEANPSIMDFIYKSSMQNISSYLMFVSSTNADTLDASFGKLNVDLVPNIGKQLEMYAKFKGSLDALIWLSRKRTLLDIVLDFRSYQELKNSTVLSNLVALSPYATSIVNNTPEYDLLMAWTDLDTTTYPTISSVVNSATAMEHILNLSNIDSMLSYLPTTLNTIKTTSVSCGKYLAKLVGLTMADYADIETLVASSSARTHIFSNNTRLASLYTLPYALTKIWDNTTASTDMMTNSNSRSYMLSTKAVEYSGSGAYALKDSRKGFVLQWRTTEQSLSHCRIRYLQPGNTSYEGYKSTAYVNVNWRTQPLELGEGSGRATFVMFVPMA
jgi:hypothetical protein